MSVPLRRAALLCTAAAVLLLPACGDDPASPRDGVSAEGLTGDVSGQVDLDTARVGGRISLRAPVDGQQSAQAFQVAAEHAGSEQPVLVLHSTEGLVDGQVVQVVAQVRLLDGDLAQQYGVDPGGSGRDDRRVLVAEQVDTDIPSDDQ